MNREDIEHMWKVASNDPNHDTNWHDPVVIRFAELVASAERSACLQIVESEAMQYAEPVWAFEIVNDIKARGSHDTVNS